MFKSNEATGTSPSLISHDILHGNTLTQEPHSPSSTFLKASVPALSGQG